MSLLGRENSKTAVSLNEIAKSRTGIRGLDEVTAGGLPRGRPTLVCGNAGCGKTLMGMEFLVRGARDFGENGVCISFEESPEDLAANVASLGFDINNLIRRKKLAIDYVYLERGLIEEAGEYDLEALFIRLGQAVDSIGAKRVLIDSVEALFAGLTNEAILRSELRRLFRWLKDRNLTAVITGERGEGILTRHGLEEYISDCVILLDHRMVDSVLTRRLRVVKYRGSSHGTNEYPFLIERDGISVLPVTSMELTHSVSRERVSTGIPALDEMFGGKGYIRGSTLMISGTAGTGKSSLAAQLVNSACASGERVVYFAFEESPDQIKRNMESISINLEQWDAKGLLRFHASRPTSFGLEMHLVKLHKIVEEVKPRLVVIDPLTALLQAGSAFETHNTLLRLIDFLKSRRITAAVTTLTSGGDAWERTDIAISSLVDVWLLLRDIETGGERNRGLYILKARGLAHSNQIREFRLTNHGIELRPAYLGEAGLLTGSARLTQEARDATAALVGRQEIERRQFLLERKRKAVEAQIAALQLELETEAREATQLIAQDELRLQQLEQDREKMATSRGVAGPSNGQNRAARRRGDRK